MSNQLGLVNLLCFARPTIRLGTVSYSEIERRATVAVEAGAREALFKLSMSMMVSGTLSIL